MTFWFPFILKYVKQKGDFLKYLVWAVVLPVTVSNVTDLKKNYTHKNLHVQYILCHK